MQISEKIGILKAWMVEEQEEEINDFPRFQV